MLDIDRFVGIPYSARHMDCADLALLVQRELYGRQVLLARPRPLRGQEQAQSIAALCSDVARRTTAPRDGDAVLMRDVGASVGGHIGTYFFINHTPCVLHTSHALGASVLHRAQDLPGYGLVIEGYYQWI